VLGHRDEHVELLSDGRRPLRGSPTEKIPSKVPSDL
jgi:hypothetical protein